MEENRRGPGPLIDIEKLGEGDLFLHRYIKAVLEARGTEERYVQLRPGDELAIRTAEDGSAELLDQVMVRQEGDS